MKGGVGIERGNRFEVFFYVKLQQQEVVFNKTGNRIAIVYLKLSAFYI